MRETASARSPHLGRKAPRRRPAAEGREGWRVASAAREVSVTASHPRDDADAARGWLSAQRTAISGHRARAAGRERALRCTHHSFLSAGESPAFAGGGG